MYGKILMNDPVPSSSAAPARWVVMGVCGCGKSAIGQALAAALRAPFLDGDAFHSAANVAKMAAGTPLDDDDRADWLLRLQGESLAVGDMNVMVLPLASGDAGLR